MNERRVAQEVALPCLSILKTMHEMRIIHRWALGRWLGCAGRCRSTCLQDAMRKPGALL